MILVDTSVWVDHFRRTDAVLARLLEMGEVLGHPCVIGELALGSLRDRSTVLGLLHQLPQAVTATHEEVLHLVQAERLDGLGIGYVDAHLLAAARLTPECALWTRDRRLAAVADRLQVAHPPTG